MFIQEFSCPKAFKNMVEPFLMKKEDVNNLPLGTVLNLAKSEINPETQPFMAAVSERGEVCMVMVRTTRHMILAGDGDSRAVSAAVNYLIQKDIPVSGIIGCREVADPFAEQWCRIHNSQATVEMNQRIYRLEAVAPVHKAPGFLRLAQSEDLELVTRWIREFSRETKYPVPGDQAGLLAKSCIEGQVLYLWQEGEAVSMVRKTRPTANGITVTLVYTPPEHRKKGYASSCVASLSQELLDSGYKFCCLYTDLTNPTSNKIYMDIGYKPIAESVVYSLKQ